MKRSQGHGLIAIAAIGGISTFALASANAAPSGQTVELAAADTTAAGSSPKAAPAPETGQIEEVTVTAQRRSERSVNTPISVFVATGDQLHAIGANDFQDLEAAVPGVHMDENGLAFQPTIRGVGSAISGPGDSANVATYVDGFYRPSMNSNNMDFYDIDSVQVLKGPQGTLFGRNATGGAILVTTNAPSFDFAANGRVSYADYNTLNTGVFVTDGITDQLAGSFSGYISRSDGSVKNIVSGQDEAQYTNWGTRAKLLYNPSDNVSFTLTYEHIDLNDPTFIAFNAYHGWSDATLLAPGSVVATARDQVSLDGQPITKVHNDGLYLKGDINFGWATLASLTSVAREGVFNQLDMDASSAPLERTGWDIHEKTFTQEFDLTSSQSGPFQWVGGLYYYNDNDYYTNFYVSLFGGTPFTAFAYAGQRTSSAAAFLDGTYNIWDNLFLTVGARYSYDHITENFIAGSSSPDVKNSSDFNSIKPRAVVRYQLTPDSNVYFSYSQGYKAGVYNVFGAATTPVSPENITAYELGYKLSTSDWTFNAAAFYYDYKDLQINTYVAYTSELLNAANSEIYGLDASLTKRLTDELSLNASAALTHARYLNFPDDPAYTWSPTAGVQTGTINGNGYQMQRVPEFQTNVGLNYVRSLEQGTLELLADYSYQTRVFFDPADVTQQPAYGLLNLRASWTAPSDKWTFSVFGNNVTNQSYITQVLPVAFAFNQSYGAPATVGAEIQFRY